MPSTSPIITSHVTSSTSLRFVWDPIQCGRRNGVITAYTYELLDLSGDIIERNDITLTSVTIDSLLPGTGYRFQVAGRTNVGIGEFSSAVAVSTDMDGKEECNRFV